MRSKRKNHQIYELLEDARVKSGQELQVSWKVLEEKSISEKALRVTGWLNGIKVKSTIFGVTIKKTA